MKKTFCLLICSLITNGFAGAITTPPYVTQIIGTNGIGVSPAGGQGSVTLSITGAPTFDGSAITNLRPISLIRNSVLTPFNSITQAVSASQLGDYVSVMGIDNFAQLGISNLNIQGGSLVSYTNGPLQSPFGFAGYCLLIATNNTLNGVTLSNYMTGNPYPSYVVTTKRYGLFTATNPVIKWDNVVIPNAPDQAMLLLDVNYTFTGCRFSAAAVTMDNRNTIGNSYSCSFEAFGGNANDPIAVAYIGNDDATNVFYASRFTAANDSENIVFVQYARSSSTFHGCYFGGAGNSDSVPSSDGVIGDGIIYIAEADSSSFFHNCIFDCAITNGNRIPLLFYQGTQEHTYCEMNDCFVFPETNGVIVDMSGFTGTDKLVVRGGNLKPSNFSDPSKVTWSSNTGISITNEAISFTGDSIMLSNLAIFANYKARNIASGQFQSDPGSTAGNSNFVAGSSANRVNGSSIGSATIGGGHQNSAGASYGTVAGGFGNTNYAAYGVLGGGQINTVSNGPPGSGIFSGDHNILGANGTSSGANFIGGGTHNFAGAGADTSVIAGGGNNNITASGSFALGATIGGGINNTNQGNYATIPGGRQNAATADYTFAAGRRARAQNQGAMVLTDSQDADQTSTTTDELTARFQNGYRLNGGALTVTGMTNTSSRPLTLLGSDANKKVISVSGAVVDSSGNLTFGGNGVGLTNSSHAIVTGGSGTALVQVAGTPGYVGFGTWGFTSQGGTTTRGWKAPIGGTWTNFWVNDDSGFGAGTNNLFFIVTNGVSTGFNISIHGAGTSTAFAASNLTYSVYIAQGTSVHIGFSNNAASNPISQLLNWSCEVRQ